MTPEFASLPVPLGDEESLRPVSPMSPVYRPLTGTAEKGRWFPTTLGSIMPVAFDLT